MSNQTTSAEEQGGNPWRLSASQRRRAGRSFAWIAVLDVIRMKASMLASAFVVTGICLPLLLLVGLKRGVVAKMTTDLSKSPTAREVRVWVVREGTVLTQQRIADLMQRHPSIELVIPQIRKGA